MKRTLVVADVHLTTHTPRPVSADLAALVRGAPGARLYVAGDLLDRSAEGSPPPSIDRVLGHHPDLRRALGEHLEGGGEVRLAAGNHDLELAQEAPQVELADALGLSPSARARLSVTPWFARDRGLHLEHGHLFDPDNAPAHPLVTGAPSLGVRFVRDFIAPTGAYAYLNRNDKLPLELFTEAFSRYGARGPYVVATFFRAAFSALASAGPFCDLATERALGDTRVDAFADRAGVSSQAIREVLEGARPPTLRSFSDTFARLYLDRVACTLALAGAVGLGIGGRRRAALLLGAVGAVCMASSWASSYNRYTGRVVAHLGAGAEHVREVTGARLVVFGHAHAAEVREGYANPGSFAFSPGDRRTYLEVSGADLDRAELASVPKSRA